MINIGELADMFRDLYQLLEQLEQLGDKAWEYKKDDLASEISDLGYKARMLRIGPS